MSLFFIILIGLLILSLLVFVHELGHFWVAKKLGVKSDEFGFGFPPRLLGIYKDNQGKWKLVRGNKKINDAQDTVFSINAIPLGGFVKIKGEDGDGRDEVDSFASKKIWKRASILSAGVAMNIVLAMVLFALGFMMGLPQAVDGVDSRATITDRHIQIAQVLPETPAAQAELKMGDRILSINGVTFDKTEELIAFTRDRAGEELTYEVRRADEVIVTEITPIILDESQNVGVGILPVDAGSVKYPWYLAIWQGIKITFILIIAIIVALFTLIKGLFAGAPVGAEVGGPVMIASLVAQFAEMGLVHLIQFTALLSVNLAIINFLPIPALDGGRIVFLLIEKIKGSPVKKEVEAVIHNIGFLLLILLILLVTFNDISRLIGG